MTDIVIDQEKQKQAKTYARLHQRLILVDFAIGAGYCTAWLALGWGGKLKQFLLGFTSTNWLLVAAFGAIMGVGYLLVSSPLAYYSGFALPQRFGLSTQSLRGWIGDQLRGSLIGAVFGGVLLELVYLLLRASPDLWWLWAALMMLFFSVLMTNLYPILLMPLFYRIAPLGIEHADLALRLLRLADKAGTHVQGVYKYDMSRRTKAANAALTGIGNTRRIILGDTLLAEFTPDEIETVLAHELGHHAHRDIPVGIAIESLMTLGGFYLAALGLKAGAAALGLDGTADVTGMPLLALVLGVYGMVTMPLGKAYSRWRERRADAYAVRLTGNGRAFASALARLANQNLADADPEPWVEFLLYSHPALSKRIAAAAGTQR